MYRPIVFDLQKKHIMSQENQNENQNHDHSSQGGRIDEQRQIGTGPRIKR